MKAYDVIVIGTGATNIVLEAALEKGLRCAQIEKGKFGGTCLNRGCIPTKVMVTLADKIKEMEKNRKIGLEVENPRINWDKLSQRVWTKIDENKGLRDYYKKQTNLDVYEGEAYFTGEKVIEVALHSGEISESLTADKIFIGVGGRTNVPEIKGLKETGYLTSESLFGDSYPTKPFDELIILGGGAIGTEFAHIFSACGTKVSIVQRNVRLLPKEEQEISDQLLKDFKRQGIETYLNRDAIEVQKRDEKTILIVKDKKTGEVQEVTGDQILICPGIVSNADHLKIENTGIEMDENGWIVTDEFLQTNVDGVWALGDVNGKQQFRHKANYEADIIAHNIFGEEGQSQRKADYELVPAVTFTYPQVAHVGMNEKQAKEAGYDLLIGKNVYSQTAKGYAMGFEEGDPEDGFAKLIVDKKTGNMLGMHIIGPQASILIQPYINLMTAGKEQLDPQKLQTVRETMVPHPSLSEVAIWTYYHME